MICRDAADGYGPDCNRFGEGHVCGKEPTMQCFDFREVVIHANDGSCGRYTEGGVCDPVRAMLPPRDLQEASAYDSYIAYLRTALGLGDDLSPMTGVRAKGKTVTPEGTVPEIDSLEELARTRERMEALGAEALLKKSGFKTSAVFSWDELVDKVNGSSHFLLILPDEADFKVAMELGVAMLLDKPIIAIAKSGRPMPDTIDNVAQAVIRVNAFDTDSLALVSTQLERLLREEPDARKS